MTVLFYAVLFGTLAYRAAQLLERDQHRARAERLSRRERAARRTAQLERELGMSLDPPEHP